MKWKRSKTDILPLAEAMQERAREVIRQSGIREAWEGIGAKVNQVGSVATGLLMKHRDIDFHIYTDTLDAAESFKAISQSAPARTSHAWNTAISPPRTKRAANGMSGTILAAKNGKST